MICEICADNFEENSINICINCAEAKKKEAKATIHLINSCFGWDD